MKQCKILNSCIHLYRGAAGVEKMGSCCSESILCYKIQGGSHVRIPKVGWVWTCATSAVAVPMHLYIMCHSTVQCMGRHKNLVTMKRNLIVIFGRSRQSVLMDGVSEFVDKYTECVIMWICTWTHVVVVQTSGSDATQSCQTVVLPAVTGASVRTTTGTRALIRSTIVVILLAHQLVSKYNSTHEQWRILGDSKNIFGHWKKIGKPGVPLFV